MVMWRFYLELDSFALFNYSFFYVCELRYLKYVVLAVNEKELKCSGSLLAVLI